MFGNIQLLRAWGAILVVLFHFYPHYEAMGGSLRPLQLLMPYGFTGVDLFFMISGFIMMHVIGDRAPTPAGTRHFLVRRFLRIYGWYLPCMLFAVVVLLTVEPARLDVIDWAHSIFLTSVYMPDLVLPISWSLSYELYFYVLIALLWWLAGRRLGAVLWLCFGALAVFSFLVPYREGTLASFLTSPFILEFLAGALLYQHRDAVAQKAALPFFAVAAALLFWAGVHFHATNNFIRIQTFGASAFATLCLLVTLERHKLYSAGRLARALGDASYAIYLLHLPFMSLFYGTGLRDALQAAGGVRAEAGFVLFIAGFLLICVAAHRTLERPLYRWLCRLADSRSVPSAVAPGSSGAGVEPAPGTATPLVR